MRRPSGDLTFSLLTLVFWRGEGEVDRYYINHCCLERFPVCFVLCLYNDVLSCVMLCSACIDRCFGITCNVRDGVGHAWYGPKFYVCFDMAPPDTKCIDTFFKHFVKMKKSAFHTCFDTFLFANFKVLTPLHYTFGPLPPSYVVGGKALYGL